MGEINLPMMDPTPPDPELDPDPEEEAALEGLKWKIHADRGFNCHIYKDKCLRRRLAVRMRARGVEEFGRYAELLDSDPGEYDRLIDTLTINVTKFFRNREMWDRLRAEVIPALMASDSGPIDVWSAGCASGEEAYSVAMLMREWAEAEGRPEAMERVSILGTDIDRRSLQAAKDAVFPEISFEETEPETRARWFGGTAPFRLRPEITERVSFRRQDLISDEPPSGQRLILCRNVIIYFDRSVQERIFQLFYDALEPGGYLVLGRVETLLGRPRSLFRPVSARERIYQKIVR